MLQHYISTHELDNISHLPLFSQNCHVLFMSLESKEALSSLHLKQSCWFDCWSQKGKKKKKGIYFSWCFIFSGLPPASCFLTAQGWCFSATSSVPCSQSRNVLWAPSSALGCRTMVLWLLNETSQHWQKEWAPHCQRTHFCQRHSATWKTENGQEKERFSTSCFN